MKQSMSETQSINTRREGCVRVCVCVCVCMVCGGGGRVHVSTTPGNYKNRTIKLTHTKHNMIESEKYSYMTIISSEGATSTINLKLE